MEVILEVLNTPIGHDIVKKLFRIRNVVKMLINGEVVTTSGFFRSYFGSPKKPYWSGHGREDDYNLKSGGNVNYW